MTNFNEFKKPHYRPAKASMGVGKNPHRHSGYRPDYILLPPDPFGSPSLSMVEACNL